MTKERVYGWPERRGRLSLSYRLNLDAGSRLISCGPGDALPTGTPQEVAMSPLLLIVFIPVFVGGVAFMALLFAAATAGSGDAFEQRP